MPIENLAHFNLRLERALMETVRAFYETIVGLKVGPRPRFSSFGYWLYAGTKDVLHLTEQDASDPRFTGSNLTFDHIALSATNWPEFERRLTDHRIEFRTDRPPGTTWFQYHTPSHPLTTPACKHADRMLYLSVRDNAWITWWRVKKCTRSNLFCNTNNLCG